MAVTGKSRFALSTVLINVGVASLIAFSILPLIWTAYTSVRPEIEIIKFVLDNNKKERLLRKLAMTYGKSI